MNKIRTPEAHNRFLLALAPIDQAMFASEQKYGVGRLERLQSPAVLLAYQRGWDAYRIALDEGDGEALEAIGPKMIAALAFMDQQATEAGHKPLDPTTWEAPLPDGRVLVLVRTAAEASAVIRAEKITSAETTLPPDLAMTVRTQHEGRAFTVITMADVARLLLIAEGKVAGIPWDGSPAPSGVQQAEGVTADIVRRGYPLEAAPPVPAISPHQPQPLDF